MELLDGKKIKKERIEELKKEIANLDRKPGIAVVQIGNDPASCVYVGNKEKTALNLGCYFKHVKLEENVSEEEVISKINELNCDNEIDGIIVQMPLPKHLNTSKILNSVNKDKDIDGLTDINAGLLFHNKDCFIPCTPKGILSILNYYNIDTKGKHVVIIGRSELVGKPLMALMLNNNATVTICHSYTNNLMNITKDADILIVAVGKKHLINEAFIKEGAVIIDVGINREDGKLYGDVNFDAVKDKCSYITPVPGGVGQMTVLSLYENLLKAYHRD